MWICEVVNRQDFVDVRENQHMDKSHAIRASEEDDRDEGLSPIS